MLLIGSTNLTRTKSTGDFFCPHCAALSDYRLRARRPFLTIYFIPVVPIGPTEEYVQCTRCGTNSPTPSLEDVSATNPRDGLPQIAEELLESAVSIVVADEWITEREISALIELGVKLRIPDWDRELLGSMCSSIRLNQIPPTNFIATVARRWSEAHKLEAIKVFFVVATSDQLGQRQIELLAWLKEQFRLSDNEYQKSIDEVVERGWDAIDWRMVGAEKNS